MTSLPLYKSRSYVFYGGCSCKLHDAYQLGIEQIQNLFNPLFTKRCKSPEIGSSDTNCLGTQCQSFKNIGSPAESAIDQDRNPSTNGFYNFRQALQGTAVTFFLAASMIGDDQPVRTVLPA